MKDPPFSNIDLIVCRNVLIYLDRKMQELVFDLFHFALIPEGYLFLGLSESADVADKLFNTINKKFSIYQRSVLSSQYLKLSNVAHNDFPIFQTEIKRLNKKKEINVKDLHQSTLIKKYAPPSIIVYKNNEIMHITNNAGRFLKFAEGEPTNNILELVEDELRFELRIALHQIFQDEIEQVQKKIHLKSDGGHKIYNVIVHRIDDPKDYAQIDFIEVQDIKTPKIKESKSESNNKYSEVINQLEEELQRTKKQLQITIQEYETSNEELRASNEELQSINEELQSSTEELETSKEELQSMNEELTTVNQELKSKIEELSQVNSDLQNLMNATNVGTIFLDRNFRIKRYTPRATEIFNLIPSDLGREINHITNNINYNKLNTEIKQVLHDLKIIEKEVKNEDDLWYLMSIRPYKTIDERIDGVVMSFIDITKRKEAEIKIANINKELEKRIRERTNELLESNKKLQQNFEEEEELKKEILNLSEQERWNIGQNLHDDLGQMLTGTRLIGENLVTKLKESNPDLAKTATEIVDLINKSDNYVRYLTEGILPVELESDGLSIALKKLIDHTQERYNLDCDLDIDKNITIKDNTISTNLFRIAQEAVHNTVKHARAKHLKVQLKKHDHEYSLIVKDDGIGFSPKKNEINPSGMGSKIIQYRAQIIGADLKVESKRRQGTTITCTIKRTDDN